MATKKFFGADGVLHEVELPDGPTLPPYGSGSISADDFLNPTGVDPTLLPVDAAAFPDLIPTAGATPTPKFADPLPGSGEGAGVGQKSGSVLRDAWNNNPLKEAGTVDSVQSGNIGSAAAVAPHDPGFQGATKAELANEGSFEALKATWTNKDAVRAYIAENGGEELPATATRDELETAAKGVYDLA